MGSWGLAVALTLRGGQHCGPVGRRAGVATAKISTALDTVADTDKALAASSGGYGRARAAAVLAERQRQGRPISRKWVTPAGVTQTIVRGHFQVVGVPPG
jgi:hypothetical protein